jgi:hypothetical protein
MPPYAVKSTSASSDSDSDDIPENFSLVQSKRTIEIRDDALRKFHVAERQRQKERNRERDRKLKERTETTRKGKLSTGVEMDVQARMARAMQDAEEEVDEIGDGEEMERNAEVTSSEGSEDEGDEGTGMIQDENDAMLRDEDQEDSSGSEAISRTIQTRPEQNSKHLPDHLFASAFAHQAPSSKNRQSTVVISEREGQVRRRKRQGRTKDLILGSRAVQIRSSLSRPSWQPAPMSTPPPKVKKFISRSLIVNGCKSKTKGWERRPANIGVLRTNGGPATGFVRGQ